MVGGGAGAAPATVSTGTGVLTAAANSVNTAGGLVTSAVTSLSALATVGTITSGVWNGTTIAVANGGTGATTAAGAATNLSVLPLSGGTLTGALTTTTGSAALTVVGASGVTSLTGTTNLGLIVKGSTGTTDISGISFIGLGGSSNYGRIQMISTGSGSYLYFGTSNNYVSGITNNSYFDYVGNFVAAGNVTAYSDERVKTNWRPFAFDLINDLSQVKSGIFDRTDQPVTQVGVSAQSLREVLPDAVLEDNDGRMSVAYGNAAMVSVIELCKEIVMLRSRLQAVENRPACRCAN
jgi:hypothetical protein